MLLYRFRPFNQHTITELLTEKLHFSHPNTWNDPFEICAKQENDVGHRFACFAKNKNDEEKDILQNILMWSHYAESHKGICIEYEFHDIKETSRIFNAPIQYIGNHDLERFPRGLIERLQTGKIVTNIKTKCWEYEGEFRMTIQDIGKYTNTNFQGINIPYTEIGLKIKAIYCGVKFEESQIETLKLIKGKRDFAIFTGKVENYASIQFTNTGAVERT